MANYRSQSLVKEEDEMNSEDGSTCSPTPKKAKIYPSERGNDRSETFNHLYTISTQ